MVRTRAVLGLGGTLRANSSSEAALRMALTNLARAGVTTRLLAGVDLDLPLFAPERTPSDHPKLSALLSALRQADGLVIASPGYHGSFSGLIKNALDYVELLRADDPPYLEGRVIGTIVTASGWQAVGSTLVGLRSVVHALRGWPTPIGVGVNSLETTFTADGLCSDPTTSRSIETMSGQIVTFLDRKN